MPELTLQRLEPGRYALGDLGTLSSRRRFGAEIEAGGTAWTLKRSLGHVITATDTATGARAARYIPSGFLRLKGIWRGTLHLGERRLDWTADGHLSDHFTLREDSAVVARFDAAAEPAPVRVALYGLHHLDPLPVLFCCHIVKRVVDLTMEAGSPGAPRLR